MYTHSDSRTMTLHCFEDILSSLAMHVLHNETENEGDHNTAPHVTVANKLF